MSSPDHLHKLSSAFAPHHIKSLIGSLIDCANHSNLEVFIYVYDVQGGKVNGDSEATIFDREDPSLPKSFWDGTPKARKRYVSKGFHQVVESSDEQSGGYVCENG